MGLSVFNAVLTVVVAACLFDAAFRGAFGGDKSQLDKESQMNKVS